MRKFAAAAVIPMFAGYLWAQAEQRTTKSESTTTKSTWNGTLVDAGCHSTHTEHKESSSSTNPATNTPSSSTTHTTTDSSSCPVTTSTTSYGLMTPDGKYVQFDEASNTKINGMMKSNKKWSRDIEQNKPVKVRILGTENGDTVVVEQIK
jgi:hypothetical protein